MSAVRTAAGTAGRPSVPIAAVGWNRTRAKSGKWACRRRRSWSSECVRPSARSIPWPLWILRVKHPEKEMFKREFSRATVQDVILTLELPNFDYEVFEEITGISKADFNRKLRNNEERQKRD